MTDIERAYTQSIRIAALVLVAILAGIAVLMVTAVDTDAAPMTEIPKHVDARTGYISADVEQAIDMANSTYSDELRADMIHFCKGQVEKQFGAKSYRGRTPPGVIEQIEEEFQYCIVDAIKQVEASQ